jgi:hypothetical protein
VSACKRQSSGTAWYQRCTAWFKNRAAGKPPQSVNALRHGLLARDVVLPGEDADAFEELWNQVRADLSPVGPLEELLVDRIVNAIWRLRRLARAETPLFYRRVHELKADRLAAEVRSYEQTLVDLAQLPTHHHGQSRALGSKGGAWAG